MEQTLGKRIVFHRKRLGLTQDQLAERLGVTAQAVSKWENDQSCPDIGTLPRLAEIFGVTTDELLGREPAAPAFVGEVDEDDEDDGGIHIDIGLEPKTKALRWAHKLWFAIYILALAGLLIAAQLMQLDVSGWRLAWTTALLIFGLESVVREFSVIGLAGLLAGAYFLADGLHVLPDHLSSGLVLPVCLLILGVCLLLRALIGKRHGLTIHLPHIVKHGGKSGGVCECENGCFDCTCSFGEKNFPVYLPVLRGGNADCSFGELTVDLRGCQAASDDCTITANCSFGELRLLVPRRFRAELQSDTSFASVATTGEPDHAATVITVLANCSFGEIELVYV